MNEQRRLAAILVADVVGYSKLVGSDEAGTLAHLQMLRSDVMEPAIAKHAGRLFKAAGDGFLVEFASAVQAVEAAQAIQQANAEGELPLRITLSTKGNWFGTAALISRIRAPVSALPDRSLPARRHGSGLISLQHLLLLLQFGRQRAEAREGFWMALEEPELHVPPPLQRRLVHRIQALSTQTFVSTHSPMVAAISKPQAVAVLRNDGGALSSTPLLTAVLPAATPNGVRKLFQLSRVDTIAAIMHEAVLVPEGRIDHDWLRLLVRAVDLRQGWAAADESRFGSYVGVVPTHDAAVEATVAALSCLHPRVTALVDGDPAGVGYAQALCAAAARPAVVLRWPDGWVVEDVVGWILEADSAAATAALAQSIAPPAATIAALVTRLKSEDRAAHGLKQDQIAYEAIADVIGLTEACCRRARELLNAMTDVLLGGDSARFTVAAGESPHIRIFRP